MKTQTSDQPRSTFITRRDFLLLTTGVSAVTASGLVAASSGSALAPTPRQTAGPFFPNWKQADQDADLTQIEGGTGKAFGDVITVSGQVLSRHGKPLGGVHIDVWQANAWGRYTHAADRNAAPLDSNFQGWAQLITCDDGRYQFKTIVPGAYPVSDTWSRPPHIHFKLSKAGYQTLTTQMYFAGHPLNDVDGLLLQHRPNERKNLLVEFSDYATDDTASPIKSGTFNVVLRDA